MAISGQKSCDQRAVVMSYRVGVLIYCRSHDGRILLIKRRRPPNVGRWCAIGGKLEMSEGESPYECALREAREETGLVLQETDLKLRCLLSEEDYEGTGHWLMFVFLVDTAMDVPPARIGEGEFKLFPIAELDEVEIPVLDRHILARYVLDGSDRFYSLHAPVGAENDPSLLSVLEATP